MISEKSVKRFCKVFTKIENYEKAMADTTQTWCCHHRLELIATGGVCDVSRKDLIDWDIYYDRPADELIFLTKVEHENLHKKGKRHSKETKRKISKAHKGKTLSEEHKRKLSEIAKGKKRGPYKMKVHHWKLVDGKRFYY